MNVSQPRLITAEEVAERLGVNRSTITRWVQSGRLPTALVFPGKRGPRLFDEAAVERFRQDQLEYVPRLPRKGKTA